MARVALPGYKPLDFPPISVETSVSDAALAAMLARTEGIFARNAHERPHWTVLTTPRFEPDQLHAHHAEFFESGRGAVRILNAFAARAGVSLAGYHTCFELGCGVGRVTLALAEMFPRVVGADIAEPMLREAYRSAATFNVANIEWLLINRFDVYDSIEPYDVLVSGIVLQHNPPPVIGYMLKRLLDKLKPGGIAFFQVPTYQTGYSFSVEKYLATPESDKIEMHVYPQCAMLELIRRAGCKLLEIREDGSAGGNMSMVSNTFLTMKL
jgi:SAM-dependent methyltransferase